MNLWAMEIKERSILPKAPASQEPYYQIIQCHKQDTRGGSYSSAEVQLVYSTPQPTGQYTELMSKQFYFK